MTLRAVVCPLCEGSGDIADDHGMTRVCGECLGSGRVYSTAPFPELAELVKARQ